MTDTTVATKSFLGVPVKGDISRTEKRVRQKPLEELAPLFQAVLDDPLIQEFGWTQYTPYFNDGDPCVFGVNSPWFRTIHDVGDNEDDEHDTEDLSVDYGSHPTLGKFEGNWQGRGEEREYVVTGYVGEHEETLRTCKALNKAIGSGAFDDVLQDNFGDHATITVTRDGIDVEFYEHD